MLMNIYLGTTAISWAITLIFSYAAKKKLKRKGFKFIKEKKSITEKIVSLISLAFKGSIPIYNILNAIIMLCMGDRFYESIESSLLNEGLIYLPSKEPSLIEETKNDSEGMEKIHTEKTYDELTIEEKLAYLERERKVLIDQYNTLLEQSSETVCANENQQDFGLKRELNHKQK